MAALLVEMLRLCIVIATISAIRGQENGAKWAKYVCGQGGAPPTAPSCLPLPGLPPPGQMGPPTSGPAAFFDCWGSWAGCFYCAPPSPPPKKGPKDPNQPPPEQNSDGYQGTCDYDDQCLNGWGDYYSGDAADCYWRMYCTKSVQCQIQYEQCVEKKAGAQTASDFRNCLEKNANPKK